MEAIPEKIRIPSVHYRNIDSNLPGDTIYINFKSGETATTLTSSDCIGLEKFVPNSNSLCESDDFLGKERSLKVKNGDILAVRGAGAYGSSMSSTYNTRRLPCEVMVDGKNATVIKK